jgi:hypothetical protein
VNCFPVHEDRLSKLSSACSKSSAGTTTLRSSDVVVQFEIHGVAIGMDVWETVGMAKRGLRLVKWIDGAG